MILTYISGLCAVVSVGFDLITLCRDKRSTSDREGTTLGFSNFGLEDIPDNQDVFQTLGIQGSLRELMLDANMAAEPWIPSRGPLETITRRPREAPEDD